MLANFLKENKLKCLNITFQRRLGQLWTHKYSANGAKSHNSIMLLSTKSGQIVLKAVEPTTLLVLTQTIVLSLQGYNLPYE